jgi:hypothetical protein
VSAGNNFKMQKIVNRLLLTIGIVTGFFGFAMYLYRCDLFRVYEIIGCGLVLCILAIILDHRRARQAALWRKIHLKHRIANLTKIPWQPHQSLKIKGIGFHFIFYSVSIGFFGALLISSGISAEQWKWSNLLAGSICLAISLLMMAYELSVLGKPACELDRDGVSIPLFGRIPWHAITGIHLLEQTHRRMTIAYKLSFRVSDTQNILPHAHWMERFLYALHIGRIRQKALSTWLLDKNELPETVEAVARFLWKQATGHQNFWNPLFSKSFNDAVTRTNVLMVQSLRPGHRERQAAGHAEIITEKEICQLSKDLDTINKELFCYALSYKIIVGVALLAFLVTITARLFAMVSKFL